MSNSVPLRISIVTPSFNQGAYVEDTVRSVLCQNYSNLEYIFMDGGSTDDTLQKVEPYRNQFAYYQSQPDGGQSAAIAKGFGLSTGDIMAYLNSDDILLPGTLSFVADFFATHPEVDCIYSHRCIIDEENRVTGHWILPSHSNYFIKRWDWIPQETCFWRRRLFEKGGNIDPSFRFAMDYDLFVRYMALTRFVRVNRFLAAFRVHSLSKTSTIVTTIGREEVQRVQKKYQINMPIKPLAFFLGKVFAKVIDWKTRWYVKMQRVYPDLPVGKQFSLNQVFHGFLNEKA